MTLGPQYLGIIDLRYWGALEMGRNDAMDKVTLTEVYVDNAIQGRLQENIIFL